jgi:hypothetical protein
MGEWNWSYETYWVWKKNKGDIAVLICLIELNVLLFKKIKNEKLQQFWNNH